MIPVKNILYPTDYSKTAKKALHHVQSLAERYDATIHLVHVFDTPSITITPGAPGMINTVDYLEKIRKESVLQLQTVEEKIKSRSPEISLEIEFIEDSSASVAEHILQYADTHDVDLIVMGRHGGRARSLLLGSTVESVVREASCPVFTVRDSDASDIEKSLERILVPVDFSSYSEHALAHAKEMAATFKARVDVLHVVEKVPTLYFYQPPMTPTGALATTGLLNEEREEYIKEKMVDLFNEVKGPQVDVNYYLGHGHASNFITDFAGDAESDLIVMGSHGLTGIERFLVGSVTERVMRTSPCPVLIVKNALQRQLEAATVHVRNRQPDAAELIQ